MRERSRRPTQTCMRKSEGVQFRIKIVITTSKYHRNFISFNCFQLHILFSTNTLNTKSMRMTTAGSGKHCAIVSSGQQRVIAVAFNQFSSPLQSRLSLYFHEWNYYSAL